MAIKQAYILCGGLGTRLGSLVKDTPKPMLPIGGKPILEHTIELLKKNGFKKVIFVAGYKAEVVEEFFKNKDWGIEVEIFIEPERLGTAGAMPLLKDKLGENFLVVYGDVFIDFDVKSMCEDHEKNNSLMTMLVRPSTHPWSADLIQTDKEDNIIEFVSKSKLDPNRNYKNLGNAAIYVMNKKILNYVPKNGKSEFTEEVFPKALIANEKLRVHHLKPGDFVRDMGKQERFPIVENYLENRFAIEKARRNPKNINCAFIDRDGVINNEVDLCKSPKEFELLPDSAKAIKLLNDNNIKTICVSNQPVLARGLANQETFDKITKKMHDELAKEGGKLDEYYYCPHHPETQYGKGVKELRIGCDCRKPSPGMILKARKEHNIDLSNSVMIGDSFRDIEAGKNAGIRTIFVNTKKGAIKENMEPDLVCDSLLEAAKKIIEGKLNP